MKEISISLKSQATDPQLNSYASRQSAFTLAEVLITLAVIGVVAVLTISNAVNRVSERKNIAKLKKVYSQLNTIYEQAKIEKGDIKGYFAVYPGMYDEASHIAFRDYFITYFNVLRKGKYSANWGDYMVGDNASFSSFTGNDGVVYIFRLLPNNCESSFGIYADNIPFCGEIFVDLANAKNDSWSIRSNKRIIGKNVFLFHVTKNKIVPSGIPTDNGILSCYTNKYACTQWVLINENMDYFHCSDLSWNEKQKCK